MSQSNTSISHADSAKFDDGFFGQGTTAGHSIDLMLVEMVPGYQAKKSATCETRSISKLETQSSTLLQGKRRSAQSHRQSLGLHRSAVWSQMRQTHVQNILQCLQKNCWGPSKSKCPSQTNASRPGPLQFMSMTRHYSCVITLYLHTTWFPKTFHDMYLLTWIHLI